jgi:hypothetical protein
MDYLEFIARVTSHIPDKGQVMVRYHGLYANARIYRSSEADVRGGLRLAVLMASMRAAVPCFCRSRPAGGGRERGIFLIFRDHEERKSIVL